MNNENSDKIQRGLCGTVVSNKGDKTLLVEIDRTKAHPLYHKKFTVTKRIKAHDPENAFTVGDVVEIMSSRPISRDKHFIATKKIK